MEPVEPLKALEPVGALEPMEPVKALEPVDPWTHGNLGTYGTVGPSSQDFHYSMYFLISCRSKDSVISFVFAFFFTLFPGAYERTAGS